MLPPRRPHADLTPPPRRPQAALPHFVQEVHRDRNALATSITASLEAWVDAVEAEIIALASPVARALSLQLPSKAGDVAAPSKERPDKESGALSPQLLVFLAQREDLAFVQVSLAWLDGLTVGWDVVRCNGLGWRWALIVG